MAAKVDNLLTQAMADVSSCKSKHSPFGKITTVLVIMSPPQKPEALLQLVDTSSQASAEGEEASLEDLQANISPTAAAYSSRNVSPPVDPSDFQAHANMAVNNMLHLKRSLGVKRQRAALELGALMCQSESQESTSVTKARAICSQAIFDAQMICSQPVLEAKTNCLAVVREAKTNRDHLIHKAEAACSKAVHEATALRISQSIIFHKEHGRYMQDLEEHIFEDESRSCHNILSVCQATLSHNPQPLRGVMATLYHLLLGQVPPLPLSFLPLKATPAEEQPPVAATPAPMPKQSPGPKGNILCQSQWGVCQWAEPPQRPCREDPLAPRSKRPLSGSNCLSLAMLRPLSGTLTS